MMREEKKAVRNKVRAQIKLLSNEAKKQQAHSVFDQIQKLETFKKARVIMHFWSLPDEIPTHECVQKWALDKQILLPVIAGNNLIIKMFEGVGNMQPDSQYHIPEPTGETIIDPKPDIIILPGVAFDSKCNRLGRGKGFYDRFLAKHQLSALLIGVAFDEQLVPEVPTEAHDFKLDMVVTSKNKYQ